MTKRVGTGKLHRERFRTAQAVAERNRGGNGLKMASERRTNPFIRLWISQTVRIDG